VVIASVLLVVIAFVTLVAGWLGDIQPLIYVSIGASVLAGIALFASVTRGRAKRKEKAAPVPAGVRAGERPPASRAGTDAAPAWSGTVRSSVPGTATAPRPERPEPAPGWASRSTAGAPPAGPATGEFLDDTEGGPDIDFDAAEDAALVEESVTPIPAAARAEVQEREGGPRRAEEEEEPVVRRGVQRPAPIGGPGSAPRPAPRILVGRPVVNPSPQQEVEAEPSTPAGPRPLVGPATAGRPRVAAAGSRAAATPKSTGRAAPKPASRAAGRTGTKPKAAAKAPAKPAARPKPAAGQRTAGPRSARKPAAPEPATAPPAAETPAASPAAPAPAPKPAAGPRRAPAPPKAAPAASPKAAPAPKPAPRPKPVARSRPAGPPEPGPKRASAPPPAAPPPAPPQAPPGPPAPSGATGGAARPRPATPRTSAPRPPASRPPATRPPDGLGVERPATTEPPAQESSGPSASRPSPRPRGSYLGNRPPAPKSITQGEDQGE
jgi:hypothetical protein